MKAFTKTLLAVALLAASAGAANASITSVKPGPSNEAFFQVYDSGLDLTYSLDLGVTVTTLAASVVNNLSLTYDLSTHANWNTFINTAGFNAATTKYGVAATDKSLKVMYTSLNAAPLMGSVTTAATNVGQQTVNINKNMTANTALNEDKLVADLATVATGQWASAASGVPNFDNLWGSYTLAKAAVNYGDSADFWYQNNSVVEKLGKWTLDGNTLSYTVTTVPLPAAVWMFGAGLMGVLRLNRRKSMAA